MTQGKKKKRGANRSVLLAKKIIIKDGGSPQGIGSPSVYHAVIVIFLEFFAWGLLTAPTLVVLHETFPKHTFLMNGLIQGLKGLLSFLSAPLIGALSDVWGRKSFLLLTVFFTCAPIPLMKISPWWYFAVISVSGVFAVTFSVVFAYVADITQEHERSMAYGLVSATFAASLVTSPAIGAYLGRAYGDSLVVVLATAIALLDICFILVAVPESLPEKMRPASWGAPISWEQADPFASLKKVGQDPVVLLICITVFLSYLPEAGQYSSFFLYLRQIMRFSPESVAAFIAVLGILSIIAQTIILSLLMRSIGNKNTILLGLGFQILQLAWYGFGSEPWMMWAAGAVAAMSSITFPAVSALVSRTADADQQEFHHSWSPVSLWSLLCSPGSTCCLVYPRTYQLKCKSWQLEKTLWWSQPSSQSSGSWGSQRTIAPGHKCMTTDIKTFVSSYFLVFHLQFWMHIPFSSKFHFIQLS
ncbi:hippocampus abundant transcript 1 protein isoform X2 [Macrotis lagotis]|uniref:hippocampus abundant transcript 1 protein isoform X2 n=1 Tax=Macrotis lagotis TaxID=92651 RepID=UPI003D69DF2C